MTRQGRVATPQKLQVVGWVAHFVEREYGCCFDATPTSASSRREPRFAEHLLVQLEVAALALRSNEEITFELDLPTGRSVDLAVGGTDPLAIEVSVRGSDREVRQYDERYQRFVARILALLSRHNVGLPSSRRPRTWRTLPEAPVTGAYAHAVWTGEEAIFLGL